jgi:tetratricopeptide (TPR) repeat protein
MQETDHRHCWLLRTRRQRPRNSHPANQPNELIALEGDLRTKRFGAIAIQAAVSAVWLAEVVSELGQFDEAVARAEDAVQIAEEADHPHTLYFGLLGLGIVHLRRGDTPRATRVLERCLDLCRTWQLIDLTQVVAVALGAAYALTGRADEAAPLVAGVVEEFRRFQNHSGRPAFILLCAGMTYLAGGRIDEAASHAREALALVRRLGARGREGHALCLNGDVAAAAGAEGAEGFYRQALALAEPRGVRPLVAHCHLGLGKLYRRTGNRGQAQEHLTIATVMYREMGMAYPLEQVATEVRQLG